MLHLYIKVTHLMDRSDLMERMVLLILQCTKRQDIFIRVKTLGGIQDETGVVNTTMALKDININLQSWRKSLNDSKNSYSD